MLSERKLERDLIFPTVKEEKLDHLRETAWKFLEKKQYDRQLVLMNSTLVEIQSLWNKNNLSGIDIRSWSVIQGPDWPYSVLNMETEMHVDHPGSQGILGEEHKQSFHLQGNISDEWVENIQKGLDFLLEL